MRSPKKSFGLDIELAVMASYATLSDPVTNHEDSFYSCVVAMKFCSMGMVTSTTWTSGYVTLLDGVLKLYDSKETCEKEANDYILRIGLEKGHYTSPIVEAWVSQDFASGGANFHSFYLMKDYGIMVPLKQLKLCCSHRETAERLVRVINANAN